MIHTTFHGLIGEKRTSKPYKKLYSIQAFLKALSITYGSGMPSISLLEEGVAEGL